MTSLDPVGEDARRHRAPRLAQPVGRRGVGAAVPPLPERLQEQPLDLHAGVRRTAARRPGRDQAGGLGLDRRGVDQGGRTGPAAGGPVHPARRKRPERRDGPAGAPRDARPAARRDRARHRLPREAAEDLRAHRLRARLLPRRTVVSEDRRLRAGRHAQPQERRLELPRLPRELRVLRRLRQLRRHLHRPLEVRRRRHGQARVRNAEGRQDDVPLRPERRPRLRVDGGSPHAGHGVHLRSEQGHPGGLDETGRGRARHVGSRDRPQAGLRAPAPAARPREGARALHRVGEGRDLLLRPLVWLLSLRDADHRGPARRRRRLRRHGVSDVHHGPRAERSSCAGRCRASASSRT